MLPLTFTDPDPDDAAGMDVSVDRTFASAHRVTRRFLIRPSGASTTCTVGGGDLIVMGGRCQKDWQHLVPKQKTGAAGRTSLNFSAAW